MGALSIITTVFLVIVSPCLRACPHAQAGKKIKTSDHNLTRNPALHTERGEVIVCVEKSQNIEAFALGHRHPYGFTYRLPSVGNTRIQRKSSFVKVIPVCLSACGHAQAGVRRTGRQVKRSGLMFFLTLQSLFSPDQTPHHLVWF